jgi:hypothetical protein
MNKIELDNISIELSPCSREYSGEIDMHIKVSVNNKEFQTYQIVPLNDMKSLFDTIWDYAGERLKSLILKEVK